MARDVRHIAVFRAVGPTDLLLTLPALRALRAGFPKGEITLIGLPWAEEFAQQFWEYVDRFVAFPGYPGIGQTALDTATTDRFLQAQQEYGYDLVLQMQDGSAASNQLAIELGGWVTAGYFVGDPPDGLSIAALHPEGQDEATRALGLVELIGCPGYGASTQFPMVVDTRREAAGNRHTHRAELHVHT